MEKAEIISVAVAVLLMAVIISFVGGVFSPSVLFSSLVISAIVIGISVCSKNLEAGHLDISLTHKTWEFQRYGIIKQSKFKNPAPVGLFVPPLLALISSAMSIGGVVKFLALLQFESKALPSKAAKKYGLRRYSGIMEWDDALIVFYSAAPLMLLAVIANAFSSAVFLQDLAKYSMIYVISNLLPISKLDGTKLFFGSRPLFIFSWILVVVVSALVFLV